MAGTDELRRFCTLRLFDGMDSDNALSILVRLGPRSTTLLAILHYYCHRCCHFMKARRCPAKYCVLGFRGYIDHYGSKSFDGRTLFSWGWLAGFNDWIGDDL